MFYHLCSQFKTNTTMQLHPEPFWRMEKLEKKIVALHLFPSFEAMFEKFTEERINNVYQYYTKEEQKYGVVAIELR